VKKFKNKLIAVICDFFCLVNRGDLSDCSYLSISRDFRLDYPTIVLDIPSNYFRWQSYCFEL